MLPLRKKYSDLIIKMSKALRKAIMHSSKLKNIYNEKRTDVNWANY